MLLGKAPLLKMRNSSGHTVPRYQSDSFVAIIRLREKACLRVTRACRKSGLSLIAVIWTNFVLNCSPGSNTIKLFSLKMVMKDV